jgi:hypothetical protein
MRTFVGNDCDASNTPLCVCPSFWTNIPYARGNVEAFVSNSCFGCEPSLFCSATNECIIRRIRLRGSQEYSYQPKKIYHLPVACDQILPLSFLPVSQSVPPASAAGPEWRRTKQSKTPSLSCATIQGDCVC